MDEACVDHAVDKECTNRQSSKWVPIWQLNALQDGKLEGPLHARSPAQSHHAPGLLVDYAFHSTCSDEEPLSLRKQGRTAIGCHPCNYNTIPLIHGSQLTTVKIGL